MNHVRTLEVTDTGSCKSNYHAISTTMAHNLCGVKLTWHIELLYTKGIPFHVEGKCWHLHLNVQGTPKPNLTSTKIVKHYIGQVRWSFAIVVYCSLKKVLGNHRRRSYIIHVFNKYTLRNHRVRGLHHPSGSTVQRSCTPLSMVAVTIKLYGV